jgi:hypothetical protein
MPLSTVLLHGLAAALAAQAAQPDPSYQDAQKKAATLSTPATPVVGDEVEGVQVTAAPRGKVEGEIEPEISLSEEDIKAYGAGNIAQLVEALEPQLRSGRGRSDGPPVFLVNGRRVTGFQEISGIPSEAIAKVEILPEEVALTYGYRADQRVMNFILRKTFRAITTEGETRVATEGGRVTNQLTGNFFKINDGARWTFDLQLKGEDALFEDERDIFRTSDTSPYSLSGNILSTTRGNEIDPALSALVGSTVTAAAAPVRDPSGNAPLLADFVAGAGQLDNDDLTANRSLQPKGRQAVIKGALTRDLTKQTSATLSASLDDSKNTSYLGLPGVGIALPKGSPFSPFAKDVTLYRYINAPESLTRDTDNLKANLNLAMNGRIADWRWTFTGAYERTESSTRTGRGLDTTAFRAAVAAKDPAVNPFIDPPKASLKMAASDTADSVTNLASGELVARGELFQLPAGSFSATVKSSFEVRTLEAESVRSGVLTERELSRKRGEVNGSFTLPIASRRREALAVLGDLSTNFNAGYEELSDFGGLITVGAGVNWSPFKPLSLVASYTAEDGAPSIQQLNDPVVFTPNVSVFDFTTGASVSITRVEGGNANLKSDKRQVLKLGANYKPFDKTDLTFNANYTRNTIDDSIASFPTITPELEAAMPERFTRDATGRLVSIDVRPVNFKGTERQELRWGINYSKALGQLPASAARPGAAAARPAGGGGPGQGGGPRVMISDGNGPARSMGGGGARPGQGLMQFSIYHTWRLQDEIKIRDGLPVLDLLDGSAVNKRGGQPRHEVQMQAGYFKNGAGVRLNGNWKAKTWVDGGVSGQDLFFSDLATLNLSLFADLTTARRDWVKTYPLLNRTRVSFNVDNLFNQKQEVHDALGVTPQAYQADYMDSLGRTVRFSVRKVWG